MMIQINKRNEPQSWAAYRLTPGSIYTPNAELREALLAEQGYICAYCMRAIPVHKRDPNKAETSKIEHIQSRSDNPSRQLDYENMVMCCPGNMNGQAHCDNSKGNKAITFSLFQLHLQQSISYGTHKGEIKSSNENWDNEINNILCLNNPMIKFNRIETLHGIRRVLENKKWKKAVLEQKLAAWKNFNNQGKLMPYCGIVIWYLEKKLRTL